MVTVSAPGKAILFGEHAVVYGEPAVAVAINGRVEVEITPCKGEWKMDGYSLISGNHPHLKYLKNAVFGDASYPQSIKVTSGLFPAAGLGSSAALSAASSLALLTIAGEPTNSEKIATLAHLAEAEAQEGRASPIDTSTATLGGCVLVSDKREDA
ncbi:MAG: mevalonate kinase, partial [Euryarchaeota archaeon]|nr:mevalonate kinase [Euryarchaeota archaeon]